MSEQRMTSHDTEGKCCIQISDHTAAMQAKDAEIKLLRTNHPFGAMYDAIKAKDAEIERLKQALRNIRTAASVYVPSPQGPAIIQEIDAALASTPEPAASGEADPLHDGLDGHCAEGCSCLDVSGESEERHA